MPIRVIRWDDTPNPNARKALLDAPGPFTAAGSTRSFRSPQEAQSDPLAAALFALPGVRGLLFGDGWMTVNKAPETPWKSLVAAVEDCLAR